jgi:hypothetical protein
MDWNHYVWRSDMRDLGQNAPVPDAVNSGCSVNRGEGYAVRSGIHWINLWVRGVNKPGNGPKDSEPPTGPRLKRDDAGDLVRDDDGHAIGGIRYPYIEVPVGVNTSEVCPLFGNYEPFMSDVLLARYPTKQDYVSKVKNATDKAIDQGFLLAAERKTILTEARAFDVWSPGAALCHDLRNVEDRVYFESPLQPCPPG